MRQVFKAECEASGIEPNEVRSIVRRLERAAKDANELGLYIFGGDARCTLRVAEPVRAAEEELARARRAYEKLKLVQK